MAMDRKWRLLTLACALSLQISGCKKSTFSSSDSGSALLSFSVAGAVDVPEIRSSETAGFYATQQGYETADKALALTGAGAGADCNLRRGMRVVTSASYGFELEGGKQRENGQLLGVIQPCASQSGELGEIAWEEGELCMIPENMSVTKQLLLMPGQGLGQSGSSFSVTEFCRLASQYYLGRGGLSLTGGGNIAKGDEHYSTVSGRRGNVQASLGGLSIPYQDALVVTYRDNRGFGLQGGGSDSSRTHAIMARTGGFRAFVFTEIGSESDEVQVASEAHSMQGFTEPDVLSPTVPSTGPTAEMLGLVPWAENAMQLGAAGTFKIYFGEDGGRSFE